MQSQPSAPPLDTINFMLLRDHYQNQFIKYFNEKPNAKSLYFDESLIKVLSFVIGQLPASCNVKDKILLQDTAVIQPANKTIIFVIRPEIETV